MPTISPAPTVKLTSVNRAPSPIRSQANAGLPERCTLAGNIWPSSRPTIRRMIASASVAPTGRSTPTSVPLRNTVTASQISVISPI